jgi:hypothetical protein
MTLNTVDTDIYAFGMTMWEVYARSDPYAGEDGAAVMEQVYKCIEVSFGYILGLFCL